jgi:hypothetical protein
MENPEAAEAPGAVVPREAFRNLDRMIKPAASARTPAVSGLLLSRVF